MSNLSAFGLFAVTAMLVCYGLEKRSHWFILAFAASCLMGSIYGFLQGAWPFGIVESVWSLVALRRWWMEKASTLLDSSHSLSSPAR
ncbi:MAG TPA: hypothetical protein VFQ24_06435 [Terriglobia bacterium]|nr:hypothetical protein [Terriglobia bacterium]